ncbi:MAG: thiolase family protein, partial [Thermoanaerobaculia bacterium]
MSKAAFVVHGARTPFARAGTDFAGVSAVDLGRTAAVEAMARAGVEPGAIDQSIFGNIATPADAANIARVIALRAGVPVEKPAHSVSRNCASGIESVVEAARLIATGEADVVLAGGVENMTQVPFLYRDGV